MSMSLPILINISHCLPVPSGGGKWRIEAQIPILVLYVSLKWLVLWRYLDTHVEELSVFEFFMTLAGVVRRRRHAWGAVCDFNSKAFEKLTTNSFYVEHEMPLRFHASHVVRWDCGVFGEVDLMGIGSAHGMSVCGIIPMQSNKGFDKAWEKNIENSC